MKKDAIISFNGRYRYRLSRTWDALGSTMVFVMLNPSTADADLDDPTIRRCIRFAKDLGHGRLVVVNLYAYRATDPKVLWKQDDPVGPENNQHLAEALWDHGRNSRDMVVLGWGANAQRQRVEEFGLLVYDNDAKVYALGLTKDGMPRHPLYLRADSVPVQYHGPTT